MTRLWDRLVAALEWVRIEVSDAVSHAAEYVRWRVYMHKAWSNRLSAEDFPLWLIRRRTQSKLFHTEIVDTVQAIITTGPAFPIPQGGHGNGRYSD